MKELYCINCPSGCLLTATEHSKEFVVEGHGCDRGADFAKAEVTNPMRSLTTTVRTSLPGVPVLPVRTDGEIPKEKIMEAMLALNKIVISRELGCGDTVHENLAGSGVRVIATSDVLRKSQITKNNMQIGKLGAIVGQNSEFGVRDSELGDIGAQLGEVEDKSEIEDGEEGAQVQEDSKRLPGEEKESKQRVKPLRTNRN